MYGFKISSKNNKPKEIANKKITCVDEENFLINLDKINPKPIPKMIPRIILEGIFNNDIVIVEQTNTAKNGEIVVAMNDDNEVTLKTFYKEKNFFRLQPENDLMLPIILKKLEKNFNNRYCRLCRKTFC